MEKRQKWQQAQELLKQRAQHGPLGQWLGRWLEGYTAPLGVTLYIGGPPGLYQEKYQSSPGGQAGGEDHLGGISKVSIKQIWYSEKRVHI